MNADLIGSVIGIAVIVVALGLLGLVPYLVTRQVYFRLLKNKSKNVQYIVCAITAVCTFLVIAFALLMAAASQFTR